MKSYLFFLSFLFTISYFGQNQNISNGFAFDGEPYLAVNPQNSQHIVVAWMGYKLNELIVIKTKNSTDGGNTWSPVKTIPHAVTGNQSADVSIQFDHLGNVFLCYIDYNSNTMSNGAIYVTKSIDGGNLWGTPVEVVNITDCPNKFCVDRPWMEIDRTPGPNQGTIYVTSMDADRNVSPPYNPYLTVSKNGGLTFATPRYLDTAGYYSGNSITQPMPSPAIGSDGTFYGVYPSYETSQSLYATLIMASSIDGGISLNHKFIAYGGAGTGVTDPYAKKGSLFITDESDENHLAMIMLAEYNGDGDVFIMESLDKGDNWTALERVNQDPISNGVLQDMVWADFNEDGDLVITWRDRRNTTSNGYEVPTEIYAAVRLNSTSTFEEMILSDQIIDHDTILRGSGNDFQCNQLVGDTLYAVWGDVRSSRLNIYMVKMNIHDQTNNISIVNESNIIETFPNPVLNEVYLSNVNENEAYQILDSNGKVVKTGNYQNLIEIHGLAYGVYYILLEEHPNEIGKFVITGRW